MNILQKLVVRVIGLYQRTLSPDHGLFRARYPYGFCRFYPSCSEYSKQTVTRYGVILGLWMGFFRILRCNPFVKPRVDLVP